MRYIRKIADYAYTAPATIPDANFEGLTQNKSLVYDWHEDQAAAFLTNETTDLTGAPIRVGPDGPHRFESCPKVIIGTGSGTVSIWEVEAN